ncbi:MAG: CinA family protein [Gammaproteobacteria bacterium]|nr:CinA family protein [Gammaproteobacteria bacterium]
MAVDNDPHLLAERLGALLAARGWTLATAESCTGGGIASACTGVAGSSVWFVAGLVTYTEAMKQRLLGVPADLLSRHGAVSEPVARAMAEGALTATEADLALAVTGIAGPGGGEVLQPVGTVWFAWAERDAPTTTAVEYFRGSRGTVREAAVLRSLEGAVALLAD